MSMSDYFPEIKHVSETYSKPKNVVFSYGTAGFRTKGEVLASVMFRVGILASLRSRMMDGRTIGVMITASHNPEEDNGVKLVDPHGEMLEASWEECATLIANADNTAALMERLDGIVATNKIDLGKSAHVVFARDTRPSGHVLVEALKAGLDAMQTTCKDYGLLTTPQLHYMVRCLNTMDTADAFGVATEDGYYAKLAKAFGELLKYRNKPTVMTVDCANGIGAPQLRKLAGVIGGDLLQVRVVNGDITSRGKLNKLCGADFVKTHQSPPVGLQLFVDGHYASLDGDADRIVFYYVDTDNNFKLLDGDKISGLAAMYLTDLVRTAGLELQVGVVQTAYANGNSTAYLTKILHVPVSCVKTGVKHLHHEAERYDIGIYFEANGHGTVLFSPEAQRIIKTTERHTPAQATALDQLQALVDLINQTVGDALSDLLLVEVILAQRRWTFSNWDQAYVDLPSRLVKVVVADRSIFQTADADRSLTAPPMLQDRIDDVVQKFKSGRAFVRPSGTEDVVRVYAEAATRAECDELAFRVAGIVFDHAGGVGPRPTEFL